MRREEGGGAPKGACRPLSAPHWQTSPSDSARARKRAKPGRARLPALRRGTRQTGRSPLTQLQNHVSWNGAEASVLPASRLPVQRAPRRPVLLPAEWCPEAARVRIGNSARGDRVPLHPSGMPSGKASLEMSGDLLDVADLGTDVKCGSQRWRHHTVSVLIPLPSSSRSLLFRPR